MARTPHPPQPHGQPRYGHGYPPQGYAPTPPPKRRRVWPWVLLGVVLVPILGFVACTAAVGKAVSDASAPATIRYELAGDGPASTITWAQQGGTGQESTGTLPWTKTVEFGDGFLAGLSLTAQRGDGDGDLTCRIVNESSGAVIAESTSSGQFAVVTCFGTPNQPAGK